MLRRLLPFLALLALPVPAAAAAERPVRAFGGTAVYSEQEGGKYFLTLRRAGGSTERLPVAPRDVPFDADLGPDTRGVAEVVYSRCADDRQRLGCDLYVLRLDGSGERPIRNANSPSESDLLPTLWRGRIAWTRVYGTGPVVYTKTLTAPRSLPSRRLPGVPQRRCGRIDSGCEAPHNRTVEELELYGRRLAQVVRYSCLVCGGIANDEVRLVDVRSRHAAQIAVITSGLSGQSWIGASFSAGRLAFAKACLGDPSGCRHGESGPYRVRYTTGTYTKASGPVRVDGFADTGQTLYEVVGCEQVANGGGALGGCRLTTRLAPEYEPTRRPR